MVIGGSILAVIVVTVVIVVARSGSGGPTTAGADQEITGDFCADFPSNWIRIQRAYNLADDIGSSRHSVMTADDVDLLSSGISKATALAAEAPDSSIVAAVSMRREISAVADFLGAAKKVASSVTAGGTPRLSAINNLVPDHSASMINQEVTIQAGLPGSPCPAK